MEGIILKYGTIGVKPDRTISEGSTVEPHFHQAAQFQLSLEGTMTFQTFRLDAPAVHYTEHNVLYGPFTVSNGHDMLVLHTKPGRVIMMRDKVQRRQANTRGRGITRCAHEVEWEPLPGDESARRQVLIPPSAGVSAEIIECPPHMELSAPTPAYGRYEVVYRGSVFVDGKQLGPKDSRFVAAGKEAVPLRCGPEGATVIVRTSAMLSQKLPQRFCRSSAQPWLAWRFSPLCLSPVNTHEKGG